MIWVHEKSTSTLVLGKSVDARPFSLLVALITVGAGSLHPFPGEEECTQSLGLG
jgi:hypothetical protein